MSWCCWLTAGGAQQGCAVGSGWKQGASLVRPPLKPPQVPSGLLLTVSAALLPGKAAVLSSHPSACLLGSHVNGLRA